MKPIFIVFFCFLNDHYLGTHIVCIQLSIMEEPLENGQTFYYKIGWNCPILCVSTFRLLGKTEITLFTLTIIIYKNCSVSTLLLLALTENSRGRI